MPESHRGPLALHHFPVSISAFPSRSGSAQSPGMTWDGLGNTERPGRDLELLKLTFGAGTDDYLPLNEN